MTDIELIVYPESSWKRLRSRAAPHRSPVAPAGRRTQSPNARTAPGQGTPASVIRTSRGADAPRKEARVPVPSTVDRKTRWAGRARPAGQSSRSQAWGPPKAWRRGGACRARDRVAKLRRSRALAPHRPPVTERAPPQGTPQSSPAPGSVNAACSMTDRARSLPPRRVATIPRTV